MQAQHQTQLADSKIIMKLLTTALANSLSLSVYNGMSFQTIRKSTTPRVCVKFHKS